jgi:hypothetical protein
MLCLIIHGACWLVILNLNFYMNLSVPGSIFGIQMPHDVSWCVAFMAITGIPGSALGTFICSRAIARGSTARGD